MEPLFYLGEVMNAVLLPSCYLPPLQFYREVVRNKTVFLEYYEHFPKQTFRNHCEIYGANGRLKLSVPLSKRSERTITKDIRIAYDTDWRTLHWRSLQSAYRRSPYFEYYEDDFVGFYEGEKFEFLVDLNEALLNKISELLGLDTPFQKTSSYEKTPLNALDLRSKLETSNYEPETTNGYYQVFGNKSGFLPNLSIVDLLFNEGRKWREFI